MNSLSDFPVEFTRTRKELTYNTEEEKNQILEFVAERISSIFSECLTQKWHEARNSRPKEQRYVYYGYPNVFSSEETVGQFKKDIKETIITELNKEYKYGDLVHFDTDGMPKGLLKDLFERNNIQDRENWYAFYPKKASVKISHFKSHKQITVSMSYKTFG